jgi:outer membrane lipoprotein SlyB
MKKSQWVLAAALGAALPVFGFAQHDDTILVAENAPFNATHGSVTSIEFVRGSSGHSPAGAIVGGVIGGVLGHQIGNGRGNDAATVAGAVGGAVVGNEVSKEHEARHDFYRIGVHFRDGRQETFDRDSAGDLRVGDRVRLTDRGGIERD